MKSFSRDVYSPLIFAAVVALLLLAATSAGWAQKDMGNIVGVVKDGTGAVMKFYF
jgi:DMSO/TMAO reductase YedYZ heme-binding membrane subunit